LTINATPKRLQNYIKITVQWKLAKGQWPLTINATPKRSQKRSEDNDSVEACQEPKAIDPQWLSGWAWLGWLGLG